MMLRFVYYEEKKPYFPLLNSFFVTVFYFVFKDVLTLNIFLDIWE